MRPVLLGLCGLFAWASTAMSSPARADGTAQRARIDYLLHCSGCHGQDGMGNPGKGIPHFKDQVGYFQRLPEGRAFLMQVPGLLGAGLSDERAASVLNWIIREFAGPSMPEDFQPYTPEEARRYRLSRPVDVMAARNAIYARLLGLGLPVQ